MAEITAAAVKAFRERTGLPMMECKKALVEANGDEELAVELLRKSGKKTMENRGGRETEAGRIAIHTDPKTGVTAMVELLCESAPVASTDEFARLIANLAAQLACGPGASTAEELLSQKIAGQPNALQVEYDDLVNKIREVFKISRLYRTTSKCGTYIHHNGEIGVLLEIEGDNTDLARDICMHVASMRPKVIRQQDLDPAVVAKEMEISKEQVKAENVGKPDNILEKIALGRMKAFFEESCLLDQAFVKENSKTVAQVADEGKIKILKMIHWILGGN
ncbi:MAG: translation elongation factor Ts [Planctomycetaceae bacterium]|jgi:elongation factor Ts|nr:translation elongation factor Ts [Planctomycetaceae bacterium]